MTKPDWKDAPDWADWLAQDKDGEWFWYDLQPNLNFSRDSWEVHMDGDCQMAKENIENWMDTLEKRP